MALIQLPEKPAPRLIKTNSWEKDVWLRLERFAEKNNRSKSEIINFATKKLLDEAEQYDQTKEVECE
ncbi:MAG: hypothetical protein JNL36_07795 [Candidatus Kapabacteria bacterium]|nr:hypothetical protein [Candidatus Kapabacteria bacterium]